MLEIILLIALIVCLVILRLGYASEQKTENDNTIIFGKSVTYWKEHREIFQ